MEFSFQFWWHDDTFMRGQQDTVADAPTCVSDALVFGSLPVASPRCLQGQGWYAIQRTDCRVGTRTNDALQMYLTVLIFDWELCGWYTLVSYMLTYVRPFYFQCIFSCEESLRGTDEDFWPAESGHQDNTPFEEHKLHWLFHTHGLYLSVLVTISDLGIQKSITCPVCTLLLCSPGG